MPVGHWAGQTPGAPPSRARRPRRRRSSDPVTMIGLPAAASPPVPPATVHARRRGSAENCNRTRAARRRTRDRATRERTTRTACRGSRYRRAKDEQDKLATNDDLAARWRRLSSTRHASDAPSVRRARSTPPTDPRSRSAVPSLRLRGYPSAPARTGPGPDRRFAMKRRLARRHVVRVLVDDAVEHDMRVRRRAHQRRRRACAGGAGGWRPRAWSFPATVDRFDCDRARTRRTHAAVSRPRGGRVRYRGDGERGTTRRIARQASAMKLFSLAALVAVAGCSGATAGPGGSAGGFAHGWVHRGDGRRRPGRAAAREQAAVREWGGPEEAAALLRRAMEQEQAALQGRVVAPEPAGRGASVDWEWAGAQGRGPGTSGAAWSPLSVMAVVDPKDSRRRR